jgi:hypothetical protein
VSQDKKIDNTQSSDTNDAKERMLAALAKKQKGGNIRKSGGAGDRSRIGAGQTGGTTPKMHRRKAGSP